MGWVDIYIPIPKTRYFLVESSGSILIYIYYFILFYIRRAILTQTNPKKGIIEKKSRHIKKRTNHKFKLAPHTRRNSESTAQQFSSNICHFVPIADHLTLDCAHCAKVFAELISHVVNAGGESELAIELVMQVLLKCLERADCRALIRVDDVLSVLTAPFLDAHYAPPCAAPASVSSVLGACSTALHTLLTRY